VSALDDPQFPALDCHAHIATDVTAEQLAKLGGAVVFAVTRSLDETRAAALRRDRNLVWGCGIHPGVREAVDGFDVEVFHALVESFALVGEVGMDRRAGRLGKQEQVFRAVLGAIRGTAVLVSVHSAGCAVEVAALVEETRHPGVILHWFLGDENSVRRATDAGCYFSVNVAMSDDVLRRFPPDRLLPETDFPSTARRGVRWPGDIYNLEMRIASLLGESMDQVRWRWYRNLRAVALASGALDRLPDSIADRLLTV
jgi:TatD DNase family protein